MKLSDFQFELPSALLAQRPAADRDESRLMVLNRKEETIEHHSPTETIKATSISLNAALLQIGSRLYLKQIEATQQAIKLLLAAYSNSGSNFEEILMMNQDLLMLKTAIITANKNQFTAQAQLEYLLSIDN